MFWCQSADLSIAMTAPSFSAPKIANRKQSTELGVYHQLPIPVNNAAMDVEQVDKIHKSYPLVEETLIKYGGIAYQRLIKEDASMKCALHADRISNACVGTSETIQKELAELVTSLTMFQQSLSNKHAANAIALLIANHHIAKGIYRKHFLELGRHMCDVLRENMDIDETKEVVAAWNNAFCLVAQTFSQ